MNGLSVVFTIFVLFFLSISVDANELQKACDYSGSYDEWANCFVDLHAKECLSGGIAGTSQCADEKQTEANSLLKEEISKQQKLYGYFEELENAVGLYNVFIKNYCGIENTFDFEESEPKLNVLHIYECRGRLKLHLLDDLRDLGKSNEAKNQPNDGCAEAKGTDAYIACIMKGFGARNLSLCAQNTPKEKESFNLELCNKKSKANTDARIKTQKEVEGNINLLMTKLISHISSDYIRGNVKKGLPSLEKNWSDFLSEVCMYEYWVRKNTDIDECKLTFNYSRYIYLKKIFE
ncbi:MAG: hypothetical protein JWM78_1105 [Verrucomicrobiaceae bacterium]|nr:hypothetical protein [Verrucomicrobiaceae bacterium]